MVGASRLLSKPAEVKEAAAASPPVASLPQQDEDSPAGEVVVLNLRPEGFEPAELTLAAGDYLLVVNNRTGLDEFALRLEREGQGTLREARPPRRARNWRQMLRLTPGTYLLTETNHPEWALRVTVTPR
ncbi:MAG TPA: hypothetical protein VEQ42_13500 [Pyrinomonadaceae bacterium]|nr:hypothetical protein [Pyrinomonadaceae bacterium]